MTLGTGEAAVAEAWSSLALLPPPPRVLPGFDVSAFHGLLMPAHTPQGIVDKINAAVNTVLAMPDVKNTFETVGLFPVGGTPDVLAQRLEKDSTRWAQIISDAHITAN